MTSFIMLRQNIITKEAMEQYYMGKKYEYDFGTNMISVNNDLESFFEDLRLGKEPKERFRTYWLPKLTEEEKELIERKDSSFLETFSWSDPDVAEAEMKLSESSSKFARGWGYRRTFTIENKS